jgi:hypothetical protein
LGYFRNPVQLPEKVKAYWFAHLSLRRIAVSRSPAFARTSFLIMYEDSFRFD